MKIIVSGCGKIGSMLVQSLSAEGHDVVALDVREETVSKISNIHDVIGVVGNGADCDALMEAGIEKTDLFVAAAGSDDTNMLSCYIARQMGATHTIARVRNPEYNDTSLDFLKKELGLSLAINPEMLAARELFNMLRLPSAAKVEKFSGQSLELIELRLKSDSKLDGMSLADIRTRFRAKILVCYVVRGDEVFIPDGQFVLRANDHIGVTASHAESTRLLRELGILRKNAKDVMLLGGSRIAFYLAKRLCDSGVNTKIIDRDEARCEVLCESLPSAVIIHGNGADHELLLEEGLLSTDAFVSLTGMDEQNILLSTFAAQNKIPKVITKINRNELVAMAENLGLESIVSPRRLVADIVVSYARALENSRGSHIETLYKLADDRAEALEFTVSRDATDLIGIPLKDLRIKPGMLIAGIMRGRASIIPSGNDVILPHDRVIVISAGKRLSDLSDILM